jgi:hypothetical protein
VNLDIRFPIGILFLIIGALLTIVGAVNPSASRSIGVNINFIWGLALLVFGIVMFLLGRRKAPRADTK